MSRRIFRESALDRYNQRLEKIELPRYAHAPWILLMWLVGLLLLLLAALLLSVRLPEYVTGPSIVVDGNLLGRKASGVVVAAFLPAQYVSRLSPGQAAEVSLPSPGAGEEVDALAARVLAVEPRPLSPAAARELYGLDAATGGLINGPVTIAVIDVDLPAELWLGSVGEARIEIGSRSLLALLPGLVAGETGLGGGQ